jgi:hypothetical protein
VFVLGKPFQPSPMFVGEARGLPKSGAPDSTNEANKAGVRALKQSILLKCLWSERSNKSVHTFGTCRTLGHLRKLTTTGNCHFLQTKETSPKTFVF